MARGRPLKYSAKLIPHYVEGLDNVIKRYREEAKNISEGSARGLVMFALHIRRVTENEVPYTPFDKGNLRASWFIAAATGLIPDPLGESGNFKTPRKGHITKAALNAQHRAITAASVAEVRSDKEPSVIFGYSANYALAVHEMVGVENWSRPGSDAKWLEAHLGRNVDTFKKMIQNNAHVK